MGYTGQVSLGSVWRNERQSAPTTWNVIVSAKRKHNFPGYNGCRITSRTQWKKQRRITNCTWLSLPEDVIAVIRRFRGKIQSKLGKKNNNNNNKPINGHSQRECQFISGLISFSFKIYFHFFKVTSTNYLDTCWSKTCNMFIIFLGRLSDTHLISVIYHWNVYFVDIYARQRVLFSKSIFYSWIHPDL